MERQQLAKDRVQLTTLELNRALLARQFLLERSSLGLIPTLERIGGLQTQYAPSGYIGLWSRMEGFNRAMLTAALERRRVIQGTLLRSTIHMVSARDYWLFLAAVRDSRQEWFRRITRTQFGNLDMEAAAQLLRQQLAAGPQRANDLRQKLQEHGLPAVTWAGLSGWLHMVRIPPSGTWDQRRADLYGLAETWIKPERHSEAAGLEHVVRRYLGGFGPAAIREIADWAGIPPAKMLPVVEQMSPAGSVMRKERNSLTCRAHRSPLPILPRPSAFSPPGTPRCWFMPAEPRSFPSGIGR